MVEIPDLVDFFQKEISIPSKTVNHPKILDLVGRNVGINPDTKISAALFNCINYQRSQNWQSHNINLSTCVNGVTEVNW